MIRFSIRDLVWLMVVSALLTLLTMNSRSHQQQLQKMSNELNMERTNSQFKYQVLADEYADLTAKCKEVLSELQRESQRNQSKQ